MLLIARRRFVRAAELVAPVGDIAVLPNDPIANPIAILFTCAADEFIRARSPGAVMAEAGRSSVAIAAICGLAKIAGVRIEGSRAAEFARAKCIAFLKPV